VAAEEVVIEEVAGHDILKKVCPEIPGELLE
jgi:hypothetical protein